MSAAIDKMLTRPEAAELLGLKEKTLRAWASDGRYGLPMVKIGRSVRYKLSDLQKFIESRTVGK